MADFYSAFDEPISGDDNFASGDGFGLSQTTNLEPHYNSAASITASISDQVSNTTNPINTMQYFDEDIDGNAFIINENVETSPQQQMLEHNNNNNNNMYNPQQKEKSASPPLKAQESTAANIRPEDVIFEEKEREWDNDADEAMVMSLEQELQAIREKLDQIKIENFVFSEEMEKAKTETSLINEYDRKIAFYDSEYQNQQKLIEEEEKLIAQYQAEFDKKLMENQDNHLSNVDLDVGDANTHVISHSHNNNNNNYRMNNNQTRHMQKSSIVLYDNSFAINHQLQLEIDNLLTQIDWLHESKIELVKTTVSEVDRLRSIIKTLQQNKAK